MSVLTTGRERLREEGIAVSGDLTQRQMQTVQDLRRQGKRAYKGGRLYCSTGQSDGTPGPQDGSDPGIGGGGGADHNDNSSSAGANDLEGADDVGAYTDNNNNNDSIVTACSTCVHIEALSLSQPATRND
nr:hypothetical protein BaRGS_019904 [Batillaria attramentaria]KAG5685405.1 hypothetical protein BaRGS_010211 [Batillaria attramentaria]